MNNIILFILEVFIGGFKNLTSLNPQALFIFLLNPNFDQNHFTWNRIFTDKYTIELHDFDLSTHKN